MSVCDSVGPSSTSTETDGEMSFERLVGAAKRVMATVADEYPGQPSLLISGSGRTSSVVLDATPSDNLMVATLEEIASEGGARYVVCKPSTYQGHPIVVLAAKEGRREETLYAEVEREQSGVQALGGWQPFAPERTEIREASVAMIEAIGRTLQVDEDWPPGLFYISWTGPEFALMNELADAAASEIQEAVNKHLEGEPCDRGRLLVSSLARPRRGANRGVASVRE
jgi:hypothetical protein